MRIMHIIYTYTYLKKYNVTKDFYRLYSYLPPPCSFYHPVTCYICTVKKNTHVWRGFGSMSPPSLCIWVASGSQSSMAFQPNTLALSILSGLGSKSSKNGSSADLLFPPEKKNHGKICARNEY